MAIYARETYRKSNLENFTGYSVAFYGHNLGNKESETLTWVVL